MKAMLLIASILTASSAFAGGSGAREFTVLKCDGGYEVVQLDGPAQELVKSDSTEKILSITSSAAYTSSQPGLLYAFEGGEKVFARGQQTVLVVGKAKMSCINVSPFNN